MDEIVGTGVLDGPQGSTPIKQRFFGPSGTPVPTNNLLFFDHHHNLNSNLSSRLLNYTFTIFRKTIDRWGILLYNIL